MYSGFLDRFTDNHQAVILVDSLQKQFHVSRSSLPLGSTAGTWLLVDIQDNEIVSMKIDAEKSQSMKREIDDRLQRLKANKTSRFKRN